MTTNELEGKLHYIEQYLHTLNKKTPHYRDTLKFYKRLRTQLLTKLKEQK